LFECPNLSRKIFFGNKFVYLFTVVIFVAMKAKKANESEGTILVRVNLVTKLKVEKYLVGKPQTIGEFFSEAAETKLRFERLLAAEEKLKRENK
jgi:hypothetical protein